MWYINGWVESLVLRREARDFFYKEIRQETDRITIALKIEPREYTIASNHLMLTSEHTVNEIERKARKVMSMLKSLN